jgi:hypothetical protein
MSFNQLPEWALQLPASFQVIHDSDFPPLGPATKKQMKPLTVATFKRPAPEVKPKQQPQPAPLSSMKMHRSLFIDECVRAAQLALYNPKPKNVGSKSKHSGIVCNLQSRMQFMRSSNGNSFTSDVCELSPDFDISNMSDWSEIRSEISVKLHDALVQQFGRDDFTVSIRLEHHTVAGGKQRYSVTATVMW